ncbi:MAG: 2-hydroxy-3-keto-5-methylthiopentenyl-phosphate phosphatase [Gaiellaceae bacterium]|nr:2-hydroxy-3-keto-5-methylthiopentenyl-phosphate phosphatase [Gaiellaceae bacterium]
MSLPLRVVLDWDGTVTEVDTLHLVLERFGDREVYERAEAQLGRTLTLNEVIAHEFETVTAPLEEVVAWLLDHVRIRPGFAELARAHRPLIVSSGFHELIEPVLEREGLLDAVELRANSVEARPDGWRAHFRVAGRCEACGEPCKRRDVEELKRVDRSFQTDAWAEPTRPGAGTTSGASGADLPRRVEVVYAGDSHSDLCASLAADRVFALGNLARWLEERGVPYRPLTDFHALAAEL